jgi:hypothetical protein
LRTYNQCKQSSAGKFVGLSYGAQSARVTALVGTKFSNLVQETLSAERNSARWVKLSSVCTVNWCTECGKALVQEWISGGLNRYVNHKILSK